MMSPVITLTTDFGSGDAYVAAMKGVILGINPEAKLVDISHSIKPRNVAQAAFVLSRACRFFPAETIHVVVVDPGVGSGRKAVILKTNTAYFVAPDNGVLSYVLNDSLKAVEITNSDFWREKVSPTFHGRDIFAPVAAHLSLGVKFTEFGKPLGSLTTLPLSQPNRTEADGLVGHIIHVDNFGNLITDIKSGDLPQAKESLAIEIGGKLISDLSLTYDESSGLLALIGSDGYLEVAVKGGSASDFLGAKIGDEVKVKE